MERVMSTRLFALVLIAVLVPWQWTGAEDPGQSATLQIGVAESDITPPAGFPMAGYYHERLADGTLSPLKAKAVVFSDHKSTAALVVCDLVAVNADLSLEIRQRAEKATGIPSAHIVVSATHSHTAPDYMRELYFFLGHEAQEASRADYILQLIDGPVNAIIKAQQTARPVSLHAGSIPQPTTVSFNRRFVMEDGSVRTWMKSASIGVVRPAGPIDPNIGLLTFHDPANAEPYAVFSNFALHADTVGGTRWSADYPYFVEQGLQKSLGPDLISIFGTGCCGDINHADPDRKERNTADYIGRALAETMSTHITQLPEITNTSLFVKSQVVKLPLQQVSRQEVERSVKLLKLAKAGQKVDFYDHVTAYKTLILDQLLHPEPYVTAVDHLTWGLSRSLAGVGDYLPTEITVITIGADVAIVCLPGEIFVELGLAIKQASPFTTTLVVELSNCVETIYIPHRAAYAGGSYEVTNSALQPGSGEMLVEASLKLLRAAADSRH
jgi:neutral ceramidase